MGSETSTDTELHDLIWGDAAAAEEMHIPLPSFKRLLAAGIIPRVKIPNYKRNGYRRSDLRKVPIDA
jgi:hypothetical protein